MIAVGCVAAKYFISAVAAERHGDMLTRHLRDQVGRNRGGIRERLTEMGRELTDQIGDRM